MVVVVVLAVLIWCDGLLARFSNLSFIAGSRAQNMRSAILIVSISSFIVLLINIHQYTIIPIHQYTKRKYMRMYMHC